MSKGTTFIIRNEDIKQNAISLIGKLPAHDKPLWAVKVFPFVDKRSLAQNNLLHKWLTEIANETGNSMSDVKDHLKAKFLTPKTIQFKDPKTGEVLITEIIPSTSDLNLKEMSLFLNNVEQFAIDYGVALPYPEDLIWSR